MLRVGHISSFFVSKCVAVVVIPGLRKTHGGAKLVSRKRTFGAPSGGQATLMLIKLGHCRVEGH